MTAELVHCFAQSAPWLAELNHARLEIVQRPLNKAALLFVVRQQVMPKRMLQVSPSKPFSSSWITLMTHLAQNLGVTENDDTILRTSQSDVETPWIIQETNALVLVAPHTAEDDIILFATLESVDASHFNFLV